MGKNIAIFASGSGTNAENIIRYFEKNASVRVRLVLSNRKDAYVLERACRLGVPYRAFRSLIGKLRSPSWICCVNIR